MCYYDNYESGWLTLTASPVYNDQIWTVSLLESQEPSVKRQKMPVKAQIRMITFPREFPNVRWCMTNVSKRVKVESLFRYFIPSKQPVTNIQIVCNECIHYLNSYLVRSAMKTRPRNVQELCKTEWNWETLVLVCMIFMFYMDGIPPQVLCVYSGFI